MELNHLQHFVGGARGGFTSAARQNSRSAARPQSSVRQLEKDLGVVLFEREKRGVRLTKVGSEIYETCQRIFREVENVKTLADAERKEVSGTVRFSATTEVASDLMPDVLARYHASYPAVWPMMFSGPSAAMLDEISRGDSELGLFFHLPERRRSWRTSSSQRCPSSS